MCPPAAQSQSQGVAFRAVCRSLECQTGGVTSRNEERDGRIREQYANGWSAVEIADDEGLSRSQVHRILAAAPDDDDDDSEPTAADRYDARDDHEPVLPIRFVGITRGNGIDVHDDWRYLDAEGYSVSALTLHRFLRDMDAEDNWSGVRTDAINAALEAQYQADVDLVRTVGLVGNVVYEPVWQLTERVR